MGKSYEKEKTRYNSCSCTFRRRTKNPKHPGNRIKELATTVDGIDAIVASHTHEKIDEHEYKNKSGEKVIVTQPGEHGKYYSKITFKVNKEKGSWTINDKFSKTIEVE
ncbi:hypothetical protein Q0Y04_05215 [Clostridioides difficile]|nr:hypothetical protein Q0Y04_05215 [Clostridioides difficile]